MADILKQRLIGALLVLSVIIIVAFFLVKNATDNSVGNTPTIQQTEFTTSVESLPIEVADVAQETLVDPHSLIQEEPASALIVESKPNQISIPAVKKILDKEVDAIETKVTAKLAEESEKVAKIIEPVKPVEMVKQVEKALAKQVDKVTVNKEQWLIQLASFSQKPNAIALQSKVKKLGLTANIEHAGAVYRVQVGPEDSREVAEKLAAKLADELKLKPQILTIKPNIN